MKTEAEIKFVSCSSFCSEVYELEKLFQTEWQDFKVELSSELPPAIIVLFDDKVIGGLCYTLYEKPGGTEKVIWFNGLYVAKPYRRQGIASKLIMLGTQQAVPSQQTKMYCYTDIPALYHSLGWKIEDAEAEPNHSVMSAVLG